MTPPASMRLLLFIDPDNTHRVVRVTARGVYPVFEGSFAEWLAWTPPEELRDEAWLWELREAEAARG